MNSRNFFRAALLSAACVAGAATPVLAQGEGYTAEGLPLGAFRLFPLAYAGWVYDDNVYRTETSTTSDHYFNFGGTLRLESDWSQHMLSLRGNVEGFRYSSNSSEDRTNWSVGSNGRIDIQRGSALTFEASHAQVHEARSDPNTGSPVVSPVEFSVAHFAGAASYGPAQIGIEFGGTYDIYDYDDSALVAGGVLDNSDRDRDIFEVYGKVSYASGPTYEIFARGAYNERSFDRMFDRNGVRRDSSGYTADVGVEFELTRLLSGNLYAGYYGQDYVAPLTDLSGLRFGAGVDWLATTLITVHLTASHTLTDTTLSSSSASEQLQFGVAFDYELLRNLIINGGADYLFVDFSQTGLEDTYVVLEGGLRYYVNPLISAGASYRHTNRSSSFVGHDFDLNLISANLNLHL